MNSTTENKRKTWWLWLLYPSAFAIWASAQWLVPNLFQLAPNETWEFSDKIGAINALFTALAFAGVIHTVVMQREELELQRGELTLTRAEIAAQREQMELQNATLRQQQFETTFFQMLRLVDNCINDISFQDSRGRIVFSRFQDEISSAIQKRERTQQHASYQDLVSEVFEHDIAGIRIRLERYFNLLWNTCQFVNEQPDEAKQKYFGIIRDTISTGEAAVLFFYCTTGEHKPLTQTIEKHGLLASVVADQRFMSSIPHGTISASAFQ